MTRTPRRKPPAQPPPPRREPRTVDVELEADPTERFERDERPTITNVDEPMILTIPPDAEPSDLAMTQPMPRTEIDEFDEDLIRTHELPMAGEDWL